MTITTHDLEASLPLLSERDRSFAQSLLAQFADRGSLSEKQRFWVGELVKRARNAGTGVPTDARRAGLSQPTPEAKTFARIVELFAKAGGRAAIVFRTSADYEFRLSVAGERSQQPGSINVTDANAGGFESRVWFGRITTAGVWQPSRKLPANTVAQVEAALERFNADPAKAAAEYGHLVGSCCFCRRELTDERSVTVGYGPICASRFSLPWGTVPGNTAKLTCEEINNADIPF